MSYIFYKPFFILFRVISTYFCNTGSRGTRSRGITKQGTLTKGPLSPFVWDRSVFTLMSETLFIPGSLVSCKKKGIGSAFIRDSLLTRKEGREEENVVKDLSRPSGSIGRTQVLPSDPVEPHYLRLPCPGGLPRTLRSLLILLVHWETP